MTVSNTTDRTSVVANNTAGQVISFSFPVTDSSEIVVIKRLIADGTETILTLTTDDTVTVNGDSGGTVTIVTAIPTTYQIHVVRNTSATQLLDLEHGGTFNAENVEDAIDKAMKRTIDLENDFARCLHAPTTDTNTGMEIPNRTARTEQYLYFDASGNVTTANPYDPGTLAVSAFMETVLDDATASAALTTLGFTPLAKTLLALSSDAAYLTELGVTAFAQTLLLAATASAARTLLDVLGVEDIVCNANEVVCHDDEVVTN
jgi:hypothetical protein